MAEVRLTAKNFQEEVLDHKGMVLVDFWADWCGPCKMLAPVLKEVAEENEDVIKVGKVNIDEAMELAQKYRVVSIPTLILFKDGKMVNQSIGYIEKEEVEKLFK